MKPRLSEAPNGIVGASGSLPRARGDLIGLAAPSASHATHSATTLPVELLSSANSVGSAPRTSVAPSAPKPTAARAPLAGSTNERSSQQGGLRNSHGRHRRTLSDSQSSSPNLNTSPRGSNRLKNVGPLQQDTRQQELVEKAVEEQRGASASGSGKRESIFYTLRAKNTRVRAPSNPNPFESMDSESTGTFSDGSSGASLDGRRGGSRKAVAGLFARASGSRTVDVPRKQQWPEQGPVSIVAGAAGGHKPGGAAAGVAAVSQPPQPEKRVGFLAKLMGRNKKTGPAAAPAAAAKPARFVFTAAELEAREAQLAAAGFSQLPGTLLSRAKGEALDPKYLMKWHQFDLKREIGEGAYAMVYLAAVGVPGGGTKDVALKELKLLGNEQSEDMHLEAAAVVDAISDCGFKTLAEAVRLGAELIRQRATYSDAKTLLRAALLQFRDCADMEDEACVQIVAVMEGLVALPPPPEQLTVPAGKTAAQRLVEDIMREVEVLSKLWHKNIVEFVGACVDLPHLAIAMQFAHKGPLSELLINDEVVMGWDLRVRWARETAEALDYLHSLDPKVIHRDLKADNILIDKNDRALVTDFGLSKAKVLKMMNPAGAPSLAGRKAVAPSAGADPGARYKSFVEFSEIAGTPSYLAPELWRNEPYTESVDVYSFGVVLWELIARDAPYRELDNEALMKALRNHQLRPPVPKWTPEAYRVLMERCWSDAPSSRPTFDQAVKLLKILEEKHVFAWRPPENFSLDEDAQREFLARWAREKESKEQAVRAAERKLAQAQQQFKTAKSNNALDSEHSGSAGGLTPSPPHAPDQNKPKKGSRTEIFLK